MIANRHCKCCGRYWYLAPRKPRYETKESIGERLVRLACSAVETNTFVCPYCHMDGVERWETDGGK